MNAERALDALGDPTRRLVFKRLRKGSRSVGEIADGMDVSRPAVSQHLKVLKAAGLVVVRAEGTRRLYSVDTRGIEALRNWLDSFWDEALVALRKLPNEKRQEKGNHDDAADKSAATDANSVRKAVTVQVPPAVAWRVFTGKMGRAGRWPPTRSAGQGGGRGDRAARRGPLVRAR
jgi:DNA-binding transcriptional ArsR family regulator